MRFKSNNEKVIVLLGPTASGKSELAVLVARGFGGEIISADSRQVYRGVDLGSDKVPNEGRKELDVRRKKAERKGNDYFYKGVRHHLIDVASPKRIFTVTQYKRLAEKAIKAVLKRGRIPIVVGGTGLYIDALINDWKLPKVKPDWKLREKLEKKSAEELFAQLRKLDPARAGNIDPHNKRRLIRAIEIVIKTGKSAYSNVLENNRISKYRVLKIGLRVSSEELKNRIKKRTLKRLKGGVIEEMESLRKSGVSQKKLNDISLYYRWLQPYIKGEMNQAKTLETIATKIGQYAKRQMTWFKRDKNINWILKGAEAERLIKNFLRV